MELWLAAVLEASARVGAISKYPRLSLNGTSVSKEDQGRVRGEERVADEVKRYSVFVDRDAFEREIHVT